MWNPVGFLVMVGVLLTAKWLLQVWDSAAPFEGPVPSDTKGRQESRAT